mmetsp:Transcript_23002/g.38859  ORF Transcript_23002/g.38859 Transcript_23002/m.38859 type:complete len:296 (-) Transcript_23002:3033-3920(-)
MVKPFGVRIGHQGDAVLRQERGQDHAPDADHKPDLKIPEIDQGDGELQGRVVKRAKNNGPQNIGHGHGHQNTNGAHEKAEHEERHLAAITLRVVQNAGHDKAFDDAFAVDFMLKQRPRAEQEQAIKQHLDIGENGAVRAGRPQDIDHLVEGVGQVQKPVDQNGAKGCGLVLYGHQVGSGTGVSQSVGRAVAHLGQDAAVAVDHDDTHAVLGRAAHDAFDIGLTVLRCGGRQHAAQSLGGTLERHQQQECQNHAGHHPAKPLFHHASLTPSHIGKRYATDRANAIPGGFRRPSPKS